MSHLLRLLFNGFLSMILVLSLFGCVETQTNNKSDELEPAKSDNTASSRSEDKAFDIEKELLSQLPAAEKGFKWSIFKGVALQRPAEWNEYAKGNTYTSSIESVPEKGMFETGLTIQILSDVKKKYGSTATVVAAKLLNTFEAQEDNEKLLIKFNKHPDMETIVFRYKNAPSNLTPIIVHKYIQISETKDLINVITFETTEEQWDNYWNQYGKVILGYVATYSVE